MATVYLSNPNQVGAILLASPFALISGSADITPDTFAFVPRIGVGLSATVESNAVAVLGVDPGVDVPISIADGEYAVDSGSGFGSWRSTPGNVRLNDQVKIRRSASGTYSTTVSASLTVGGVTAAFNITTQAQPNRAPVLNANINNQTGSVGDTINLNISPNFSDLDLDPLTYAVTAGQLPSGLTLNENTGLISGTLDSVVVQAGVVITASDGSLTVDSNPFTWTVNAAATNTPATGQPAVIGIPQEGRTLTANTSGIVDPDGFGTFSYQWQRGTVDIPGATGVAYTVTVADVGSTIRVVVSYTDGLGFAESVVSASTATVTAQGANNPATGLPIVVGTAQEGHTLSVDTNSIADVDGLGGLSYQWQRGTTDIPGATNATYVLGSADVDATLRVIVSFTDGQGYSEVLTSASTATVVGVPAVVPVREMVDTPDVDGSGFDVPRYKQYVGEEWPYSWEFSDQATKRATTIQSVSWDSVGPTPVSIIFPQLNGNKAIAVVNGEEVGVGVVRVTCRFANGQDRIRFFRLQLSDVKG